MPTIPLKFSQLSGSKQKLIRIVQTINYGSILNLTVINGELNFDPGPEVLIDIRLDEEVLPRPETNLNEFSLGVEVCRLLAQIEVLQNGSIERIIVHAGVPRRVTLRSQLKRVWQ